jgi:hypothetical protein
MKRWNVSHTSVFLGPLLLYFCTSSFAVPRDKAADGQIDQPAGLKVGSTIESTLATGDRHIRQFAFDGDADTYFLSQDSPSSKDHFTLVLERPVAIKQIAVTTGKPAAGGDALDAGILEVSEDTKTFAEVAKFSDGVATAKLDGRKVQAIRVRPSEDLKHPLAIREFVIDSDPRVATFLYPIEIAVDSSDAPDLSPWLEKVGKVCERQYPMICEELGSDGFKPRTFIKLKLDKNYKGVAEASGSNIRGSVTYFKSHPDDIGAFVHETVHCVQNYGRQNPGWLVEGIADYIRFYKYEPGKARKLKPEQAQYDGSYRVTAAFLASVSGKYDKELVKKLNAKMREGKYQEELWKDLTGKTLAELGEEWKESLK